MKVTRWHATSQWSEVGCGTEAKGRGYGRSRLALKPDRGEIKGGLRNVVAQAGKGQQRDLVTDVAAMLRNLAGKVRLSVQAAISRPTQLFGG